MIIEKFATARFTDLSDEFNAWRAERGIEGRPDAYNLLKGKPSPDDREYLRNFIKRWETRILGDA